MNTALDDMGRKEKERRTGKEKEKHKKNCIKGEDFCMKKARPKRQSDFFYAEDGEN